MNSVRYSIFWKEADKYLKAGEYFIENVLKGKAAERKARHLSLEDAVPKVTTAA